MTLELVCEVAGTLLGLAYLYWEYHADARVWIAGMLMPAVSLVVYWRAGLYADFGINVYYLLAAAYGLRAWRAREDGRHADPWRGEAGGPGAGEEALAPGSAEPPAGRDTPRISRAPRRAWPWLALVLAALTGGLHLLLLATPSTVPLADALTTALSIVALWMLARRWVEQWLVWLAVDVASTALYIYKGLHLYALLYALYALAAVAGYFKWRSMMRKA